MKAGVAAVALVAAVAWLRVEDVERAMAARLRPEPSRAGLTRRVADEGNAAAQAFYGLGSPGAAFHCEAVLEASRRLASLPRAGVRPSLSIFADLHDAHPPSVAQGDAWRLTAAVVDRVEERLLQASHPVDAGALLAACVHEAGAVDLGVLACHNLTKDLTLRGRRHRPASFPARDGALAAAVRPWRRNPLAPTGEADKLGPVYHLFATMTLATVTGSPRLASLAADAEAARRSVSWKSDRPDPEKAEADRCGVAAGAVLLGAT